MAFADGVLRKLDNLSRAVSDGVPEEITKLCESRAAVAQEEYANAGNRGERKSGENGPVKVVSSRDGNLWTITASGHAVLFLEYGTGIRFPRTNPEDPYGAGEWSATHEQYLTDIRKLRKYHGGWPLGNGVISYGNPSYNVMYDTKKYLREHLMERAKQPVRRALR